MKKKNQSNKNTYFYFDLSDESHQKLVEKELEEVKENPLSPLKKVTEVEY